MHALAQLRELEAAFPNELVVVRVKYWSRKISNDWRFISRSGVRLCFRSSVRVFRCSRFLSFWVEHINGGNKNPLLLLFHRFGVSLL